MPRKCESCRFFEPHPEGFTAGRCSQMAINLDARMRGYAAFNISRAREVCDREGDGHFVYFEPKTPTAGAFVQITREKAMTAGI